MNHISFDAWLEKQNAEEMEQECPQCNGDGLSVCCECGSLSSCSRCDETGVVSLARKIYREQMRADDDKLKRWNE